MRKSRKLLLSTSLIIFALLFSVVFAGATADGISDFAVIANIGEAEFKVNWWQSGDKYYLFLPSDADLSALTVDYTASSQVTLNGSVIEDDGGIALEAQGDYVLACGEKNYDLEVFQSQNVSSVHITTASGSMDAVHADKSHKEEAEIIILSEGEIIIDKELEYIKGRGNATWTYVKKPYNIKFDKKTDLFGMGKAKKWSLLANYIDHTSMRNHVAFNIAQTLGIEFTSEHTYIDLYINDEYYGNYILCESVEVGETRVDITDLEGETEDSNPDVELDECALGGDQTKNFRALKPGTQKWVEIPNNPEDITGGYLLEYELPDRYINEVSGFITERNQTIVLKSPEYASEAQVKYISSLYQQFEDAIYSENGYNSLGRHYSEYIDVESFVRMYVFQEFAKNLDAGITSFYIYKDADSDKLVAGPVWDFDRALGDNFVRFGMNTATPDGWWSGIIYHWTDNSIKTLPTILNALYRQDDFFALALEEWQNSFSSIITEEYISSLSDFSESLTPSAVMNAVRWNNFATTDYESTASAYKAFVSSSLLEFITGRKEFLDKGFSDTSVRVFYNANGGTGNMFNESAIVIGETLTFPECTFTRSGYSFDSWNTRADGRGESFKAGDSIILDDTRISLYAQWTEIPVAEPEPDPAPNPDEPAKDRLSFFERIIKYLSDFFEKIKNFFSSLF